MKTLDFLVIGAQKCATTTLFELLRQHPQLQLPLEKEVPFFTRENCSSDWIEYLEHYFPDSGRKKLGKVTPQYMGDSEVPERLSRLVPRCKLIAVLRNPLERSFSHYRMGQRRDTEHRSFSDAMAPLLEPRHLDRARRGKPPAHETGYECEADFYLGWSEYGRILSEYLRFFHREQLLVIYSEDLQNKPREVLDQVLRFIGVSTDFQPCGLGEVMHAGGSGTRIPAGIRRWLRERRLVAALWRRVSPEQQGRIRFLFERWNTRTRAEPFTLPKTLESALREHFRADLEKLRALGAPTPPWLSEYERAASAT